MASETGTADLAKDFWGTREELLLAFAVSRHGTRSWDSVAMEIQARSHFSDLLTPQNCRQRYLDLKRRFESGGDDVRDEADVTSGVRDGRSPAEVPWLDELRELRMAELRREVERYDVSITSLQLKLKNLRDERERSEADEGEPDLKDKETIKDEDSPGPAPSSFVRDRASVGDSGGSCKESNSTDPKAKSVKPVVGERMEPDKTPEADDQEALARSARENSYNGSSETLSKGSETAEAAPPLLGESGESTAEEKESSDVQSSASLSRLRRGRHLKTISGSSSVAEEAETDAVSPVTADTKRYSAVESHPLAAFLEIIRSNKYGSVFARRLDGQENLRYRSVIRRHVDLEIVRSRLERRGTKYSCQEFFRDLLLLCTNAIVFFRKGSSESIAAGHLRQIVTKEMAMILRKPAPSFPAEVPKDLQLPLRNVVSMLNLDSDLTNPLPKKNRSSSSIIACRKPNFIDRGAESDFYLEQETRERPKLSGIRGLRTNKGRGGHGGLNYKPAPSPKPIPLADAISVTPTKKAAVVSAHLTPKKRNAASFLNRLKGSSMGMETLLNSLKSSNGRSGGRGSEQKKFGKGEGRKEAGSVSPDSGPPTKRSVGRPPKRTAPTPTPPPSKRVKMDVAPAKRPPPPPQKKRGRK